MSTARRARTLAYAGGAFVALTVLVGTGAVALSHFSDQRAAASASLATAVTGATAQPASSSGSPEAAGSGSEVSQDPPTPSATTLTVPPLHTLTPPDAIVTIRHAASVAALHRLGGMFGVHRVAFVDSGTIRLHGVHLHVLGVPLSTIRGFTPQLTAASTALWKSVARGELTIGYADSRHLRHDLGDTFTATGPDGASMPLRIGAFATIGLNGAQALVSEPTASALGLASHREVLIAAPKISLDDLTADVHKSLGDNAHIDVTRTVPVDQAISSSYATSTIPASYLDLYRRAALTCPGLPWTVLAGIGTVETGNGRDVHKSTAGAEGPMQFLPSTWAMYGYDADGDGKADINDPVDAVFSAARYLCAAGAGRGGQSLDDAIFSYNHAWWYVREVIVIANRYA